MKNKFMRSVTAMVVAVTMLISSQGVVTSFADGGDHSDMSESSSVQMNEVDNNGTDQSTKDDAAQCNCGATDGEAHKEGCPLYVKPDGGNTENDAAQCTCGAKEGEPHQENCPLYVKPDDGNTNDGDTDNGAGEDTNIKSVVDTINALPAAETITEETDLVSLKDQVNAARVAYDALSDDQKADFDAATLEKLTALEAKISELESGEQETAPSEAVQNVIEKIDSAVEQIDYTTETISATDGTTVTKTHITMLKDLDPANNAELKALIDKEAAHEQDETQPALTDEEAAKLSEARKAFEDASAKYLSEGFSNAQLVARQAYDALATEEEKAQVTNYSLLTDMEANIAYIMQAVNTLPETPEITPGMDQNKINEILKSEATEITIKAGTYSNVSINVTGKTLIVNGVVEGLTGFSLNNATLKGATDKGTDKITLTDITSEVTFNNGVTLENVTLDIKGAVHNFLLNWASGNVNITNSTLSASDNTKGCGLYAGGSTAGSVFYANNSEVHFDHNVQGDGGSGIWANGDGNPNAAFKFENSTLTMNNNGLNGFMGVRTGKATFNFINTNVTVTGNGSSTDGGEGDGFSYGYITLKNTDNGDYTFNVSGNDNNGLDGGWANNAALDANGYTIKANGNGNIGINISKLNEEKTESSITDCTVEANGNGSHGLSVKQPCSITGSQVTANGNGADGIRFFSSSRNLSINNSSVTANGNTGSGLYFYGNKLTTSGNTSIILNSNQNSGLYVYRGTADLSGADVTIMTNNTSSNGGGIYNKGTLTLPNGAKVYNNHATKAGDDIYNTGEITFSRVGTDWTLDDTNLPITGWYYDGHKNGDETKRWKQDTQEDSYQLFNSFDENGKVVLNTVTSLKAAHAYSYDPKTPVNPGTEWQVSKSKTATNLDANYQSQITLSLPSSEYQLASDVVFVLDKSTSGNVKDDAIKMLESLKSDIEENGAKVNVGIVIFNQAASRFGWYDLITEYDQIIEIFNKEIKDGTNLNAGLLAAKEMLEEHTDVDPNRKHMILVSDGISYYYCEGTNYQQGYTIASLNGGNDGEGSRNCTPDSTLSAWGIKYGTYGADNEGFSYIPDWSQWESGMPALLSSDYTKYQYQVGSPDIPTEADSPKAVPFNERKNYPINVDISLYNSLKLYRDLASKYHCYAVLDGTTNKYTFGTPFMEYMAGETFVGSSSQEKFLNIKNDIFYLVDEGSSIVDVIGEGIDNAGNEYDFKFINDINNLNLTVNGISLPKEQIVENTSYGFGEKLDNGKYEFELTYYPDGIGKEARSQEVIAGELFRLDINVPITIDKPVQLTYTVQLTNPQTADGTYGQYDADGSEEYAGLYTNKMAILYPVDSNGVEGEQEAFQKPTVSYSISNGKPVDPPVDPEDPTPRPGGGGDEDDDTPTIINETPVPTTTIDDEDVPLTDLPEDTVTIDDEEVPLKDIPNTGDMIPVPAMVAAVISIGGIALLMKKHK